MAIAFVAAADGGNTTAATSFTWAYTVGGGTKRILFVSVEGTATDIITGATYAAASMTLVGKILSGSSRWEYLFYLLNPASGANNVVVSASSTCDFIFAGASDYSGVKQVAPEVTGTNTSGVAAASLTTSITTISDNAWIVLMSGGFSGNAAPTAGSGSTFRVAEGTFGTWGLFDSGAAITPAQAYSMTTVQSSGGLNIITHIYAAFAPDTGGAQTFFSRAQYDLSTRRASV